VTCVVDIFAGPPAELLLGSLRLPCVLGRAGVVAAEQKREGDGATPVAEMAIRGALLRPDAGIAPPTMLPWRWLRPDDGWSDDPADPDYNRPVFHPHAFSTERLWREDRVYDVILALGWNDAPPAPGRGSAIFWHLARPDLRPTEGCIAVVREAMEALLARLAPDAIVRVHA
jgi:L,D-peptidoglycan transpeptidase YkuD (ErfK/YbiS/YcfS/YnhG family)